MDVLGEKQIQEYNRHYMVFSIVSSGRAGVV
jgi:hypothetical protein